jgi:hypothetical protein
MMRCQAFQTQMLEYLYDLLEVEERLSLEAHLKDCPVCQASMEQAVNQQGILARATRLDGVGPVFQRPEPSQAAPSVVASIQPVRFGWRRFAVAAALLLLVAGAAGAGLWLDRTVSRTNTIIANRDADLTAISRQIEKYDHEIKAIEETREDRLGELSAEERESHLRIRVIGPRSISPGQEAKYRVEVTDQKKRNVPVKVEGEFFGKDGKPLPGAELRKAEGDTLQARVPNAPLATFESALGLSFRADQGNRKLQELTSKVPVEPPTYRTFLSTDKPIYQPGDEVRFRSLTLNRATLTPPQDELDLLYTLTNPSGVAQILLVGKDRLANAGKSLVGADGEPLRGIGAGTFPLDLHSEDGPYTLTVVDQNGRLEPRNHRFLVRRHPVPRYYKSLDFADETYKPGQEVVARGRAIIADKGPVSRRPVEMRIEVDGKLYDTTGKETKAPVRLETEEDGSVPIRFKLPPRVPEGKASVQLSFDNGGPERTIVRPVPIASDQVDVAFFPEGGDLVAGLLNRVYFQATNPGGHAVGIQGRLLEDGIPIDVLVNTTTDDRLPQVHQGRGRFEFTPIPGKKYQLQVVTYSGKRRNFALPEIKQDGVVLQTLQGVVRGDDPVEITVRATRPRPLVATLNCRGNLLDIIRLEAPCEKAVLRPGSEIGGICRVTLYEDVDTHTFQAPLPVLVARCSSLLPAPSGDGVMLATSALLADWVRADGLVPVAERLVYREPQEHLELKVVPQSPVVAAGGRAQAQVVATTEKGERTAAVVMAAAVDRWLLDQADEEAEASMPAYFLLAGEIEGGEDLEHIDVLLAKDKGAADALDLFLGVYGWRRFDVHPANPGEANNDTLLAFVHTAGLLGFEEKKQDVRESFAAKVEEVAARRQEAEEQRRQIVNDAEYAAAQQTLHRLAVTRDFLRANLLPLLVGIGVVSLLAALLVALKRRWKYMGLVWVPGGVCAAVLLYCSSLPVTLSPGEEPEHEVVQVEAVPRDLPVAEAKQPSQPEPEERTGASVAPSSANELKQEDAVGRGWGGFGGNSYSAFRENQRGGFPLIGEGLGGARQASDEEGGIVAPTPDQLNYQFSRQKLTEAKDNVYYQGGTRGGSLGDEAEALDQFMGRATWANRRRLRDDWDRAGLKPHLAQQANDGYLVIREYAHERLKNNLGSRRADFTESVYWNPAIVIPPDGQANITFDLNDAETRYELKVIGHTLDGRLGVGTATIQTTTEKGKMLANPGK